MDKYYEAKEVPANHKVSGHFTVRELACKCCGVVILADGFATELELLREAFGHPLKINSGSRCKAHNESVGGSTGSFHLTHNEKWKVNGTCAVDVGWSNWSVDLKRKFLRIAKENGWSIGKANSFCHIDKRTKYTNLDPVEYTYNGYAGV